ICCGAFSPLLAQNGQSGMSTVCPLSGARRTSNAPAALSSKEARIGSVAERRGAGSASWSSSCRSSRFAKLVHGYRRLAFAQTDDALRLHVDLSVPRITRHFFPDPTGEVEFLIRVLQLNLCKHYII